jgi:hypothetical protein
MFELQRVLDWFHTLEPTMLRLAFSTVALRQRLADILALRSITD